MERDVFLARVREAQRSAVLPPHPAEDPGLLVPELERHDLAELFTARLHEAEGVAHRVQSDGEIGPRLAEIAAQYECRSFIAWDDDQLPVAGLRERLRTAGLGEVGGVVDSTDRLAHQTGYLDLDLGLTGAEAGFAESGTIVLRSGRGRPRMASVIPLVHVAILSVRDLHRSLSHWAADHAATIAASANVAFITGPSKTGDIEQHINVGVHGPRYVHVLLRG